MEELSPSLECIDQMSKTITPFSQIGIVNLWNITDDNDFWSLTQTSQDRFHFLRSSILCLINDDQTLRQTSSSKEVESKAFKILFLHPAFQSSLTSWLITFCCFCRLAFFLWLLWLLLLLWLERPQEFQIVIDRTEIRINLLLDRTWQKAHLSCPRVRP